VKPTGIIFASVDCDADAIEDWNRWYDLEHLPPNIAIDGIMTGRRYYAGPAQHAARLPTNPMPGFADGQGVHVTIYTLCADPSSVIAEMTSERDNLEEAGRMFAPEKKVVRAGDAMHLAWSAASPELKADAADIPHIGHTAIRVVIRNRSDDPKVEQTLAESVVASAVTTEGVHAVMSHDAVFQQGTACDIYLLEGDAAEVTQRCRVSAPYPDGAEVLLDAPFELIVPFDYSFADAIRASDMPQTIR
jgi:hypothetical protein